MYSLLVCKSHAMRARTRRSAERVHRRRRAERSRAARKKRRFQSTSQWFVLGSCEESGVRLRAREIVLLTEANERQRGHWLPARETHHDWYLAPTLSVSKRNRVGRGLLVPTHRVELRVSFRGQAWEAIRGTNGSDLVRVAPGGDGSVGNGVQPPSCEEAATQWALCSLSPACWAFAENRINE